MGPLSYALLALCLAAGCHSGVAVPRIEDLSASAARWPQPPDPARVAHLGEITLPEPGLDRPLDVGCGHDRLVIADPDVGEVWLVDLARGRARRAPHGPNAPQQPVGAAVAATGEAYVADAAGARVAILRPGGRRWRTLATSEPLERPTAAAPLPDRRVAVVDAAAHRIVFVDPASGQIETTSGGRGEIGTGFNFPVDAVADGVGGLLVSDALNAAVQRTPPGGGPPTFVAGGPGEGGASLIRPKGLALDGLGRLHVVDAGMQHVQVYDSTTGALLGRYGEPGEGPGQLALPAGLCIDGDLVYVADSLHRRVVVYALLEAP